MTITTLPTRNEYTATASQTVFTYTFKIFDEDEIKCYVTPADQDPDDSTDEVTINVVTGVGDEDGGTIEIDPVSAGNLVTIVSDIAENRVTDYQVNGDFSAPVVNADFDRVVSLVKQVSDATRRTLTLQESQQGTQDLTLANPEALRLLQWNLAEDGIQNYQMSAVLATHHVDTIAELRLFDISELTTGENIVANGYWTIGDGGGGPIRYLSKDQAPGTYTDNGGSIIVPSGGDGSAAWLFSESQYLNVKWYGIKGDGIQDDAPYFNNLFGDITTNMLFIIPPGNYRLENVVFASFVENITVLAYGAEFSTNYNGNIFQFDSEFALGSTEAYSFNWFGGNFKNVYGSTAAVSMFKLESFGNPTIRDANFTGFEQAILLTESVHSCTVENNQFNNCTIGVYFVSVSLSAAINIINNHFRGDHTYHILCTGPQNSILIQGNMFHGGPVAATQNTIYIDNAFTTNNLDGISIISNWFYDGADPDTYIRFVDESFGSSARAFRAVSIIGNTFKETDVTAIVVQNCIGFTCHSNGFEQTSASGVSIAFDQYCTNIEVGQNNYATAYPIYDSGIQSSEFSSFPHVIQVEEEIYGGSVFSSTTITYDLTTVPTFPVHAPLKGVGVTVSGQDSGSAGTPLTNVSVRPPGGFPTVGAYVSLGQLPNNYIGFSSGVVTPNSDNEIEIDINASGTNTMTVYLTITQWIL